ncbi:hypothetical protein Y1Q_0013132 [Alligator mississippiensis]|uniref:Uncharacterized protein n=1 Tax=Alligator mississippiensis TaxID=8496 RepID=A0A151NH06_ALLMI|nr:hypothetical protein Y1Q_0013132 [Alligator mississippiensis]
MMLPWSGLKHSCLGGGINEEYKCNGQIIGADLDSAPQEPAGGGGAGGRGWRRVSRRAPPGVHNTDTWEECQRDLTSRNIWTIKSPKNEAVLTLLLESATLRGREKTSSLDCLGDHTQCSFEEQFGLSDLKRKHMCNKPRGYGLSMHLEK